MKIATVHFVFRIKTSFLRGFKKVNSPIIKINDSHYGAKMSAVLPLMVFYLKFQRVLLRETHSQREETISVYVWCRKNTMTFEQQQQQHFTKVLCENRLKMIK